MGLFSRFDTLFFGPRESKKSMAIYMDDDGALYPGTVISRRDITNQHNLDKGMKEMARGHFQKVAIIPVLEKPVTDVQAMTLLERYQQGQPVAIDCNVHIAKHPGTRLNRLYPGRKQEMHELEVYLENSRSVSEKASPVHTIKPDGLTPR